MIALQMQRELGGTALADYVQMEIQDFLESMKYPVDLLNYNTGSLELLTVRVEEPDEENPAGGYLEPRTELGQFVREVSLGLKSLQFEVGLSVNWGHSWLEQPHTYSSAL